MQALLAKFAAWLLPAGFIIGFAAASFWQGARWDADVATKALLAETAQTNAVDAAKQAATSECNILLEKKGNAQKANLVSGGTTHAYTQRVYAECGTLKAPDGVQAEPNGNYKTSTHYCMGARYLADLLYRGELCEHTENTAISQGAEVID